MNRNQGLGSMPNATVDCWLGTGQAYFAIMGAYVTIEGAGNWRPVDTEQFKRGLKLRR